jgi:SAM-dependent methyltransferase
MSVDAEAFRPVDACWICGGRKLTPYHTLRFDLDIFRNDDQDHELAAYTGASLQLVRCGACGFGQPQALPTLSRYFDRLYDQRHDESWIAGEFGASYKDLIFASILRGLSARVRSGGRRLLDVGTHAGRFLQFATRAGWHAEGVELNPRTAAFAAAHAGVPVHQTNATSLAAEGHRYDAIVLTDVLEHIPAPLEILATLSDLLAPGGVLAVKVPCGSAQALKERTLAALTTHRATLADNLVHVNHFSPASLARGLDRVGLIGSVSAAAPELNSPPSFSRRAAASNMLRLGLYHLARIPGAVHTPIALHLQAYGVRPIA